VDEAVRPATAGDMAAVRALMRGERVNPLGIDWPNFVVATRDGEVVGCAQLRPAGRGAVELGSLVVRADLRGAGLGGRLIAAALGRAGEARVFAVIAATRADSFSRWGFRPAALSAAPWPVRRNWLLGQAGSMVALAHGLRPRRLAILVRERRP
jgi:N-acetylglutamate synthase-like GNAT family acetyltransferase